MTPVMMVRFYHPNLGERVGIQLADTVFDITMEIGSVSEWLKSTVGRVDEAIEELNYLAESADDFYPVSTFAKRPTKDKSYWLAPVDRQDVWAAGVTYSRSRTARQEEAVDGGDVYARVYEADRPEIFFKATGPRVVGPFGNVGIRSDANWNVPEPELGLVINPAMEIVGMVVGNDMSSRDIEGDNPLYLPQAKFYDAACSLGPGLVLGKLEKTWPDVTIKIRIERGNRDVFSGQTHSDQIRRDPAELVDYLGRCLSFPDGAVLLTGTGIVPPDDFTLKVGDRITISVDSVGLLENRVIVV